ncbi:MAG: hypothetical protein M3071_20720 [Actinomycetota bacterium]|nr:hypothetical protein [Actinomycetota bacterium]
MHEPASGEGGGEEAEREGEGRSGASTQAVGEVVAVLNARDRSGGVGRPPAMRWRRRTAAGGELAVSWR